MVVLKVFTNDLTMWLTVSALIGYAFIYTSFLKRANDLIGAGRINILVEFADGEQERAAEFVGIFHI